MNSDSFIPPQIDKILEKDSSFSDEEVKILIKSYKKNLARVNTIMKHSDKQQLQLHKLNKELDIHKTSLQEKVKIESEKRVESERVLFEQSRLASMGEMMDAVAHQWAQPLSVISAQIANLEIDQQLGNIDENYIKNFSKDISKQIEHMTNTLYEFRKFLRPTNETKEFDINSLVLEVIDLVEDDFKSKAIDFDLKVKNNFTLNGNPNDFIHIILNIVNNAKDAFLDKDIKDKKIIIEIDQSDEFSCIKIIDNAGGISEDIIADVFKPNFTTKQEQNGTGIGLYMSTQIANKYGGTLEVANFGDGAMFTFRKRLV